jgi:Do/DeqQ family serine protease
MSRLPHALLLLLLVAGAAPAAETRTVPVSQGQIQLSFAPVVKRAAPAVVNIFTRAAPSGTSSGTTTGAEAAEAAPQDDPAYRRYLGEEDAERDATSLGSGVIVDPHGTIVTNRHVVENAEAITVVLADRREFAAKLLRTDDRTDLAVLQIDPGGEALPFLELRASDELEVGDIVLAIGNPFGVGQTVTSGIVSALARNVGGGNPYRTFIQTDAAINPGNSGGALVSLDGKLVGINTALFSQSGGSIGIGFAIPTELIRTVLANASPNAPANARIVRPWLGAIGSTVTAVASRKLGLPKPGGVSIEEIAETGPAAQAGLKLGDVILSVDGKVVEDMTALRFRFATLLVGTSARLGIWRGGESRQIEIKLTAPPEIPPRTVTQLKSAAKLGGATVASLSPALAEELQAEALAGAIVLEAPRGSAAQRFGLEVGDVIESVDGKRITNVAGLQQGLAGTGEHALVLRRDGRLMTLPGRPSARLTGRPASQKAE